MFYTGLYYIIPFVLYVPSECATHSQYLAGAILACACVCMYNSHMLFSVSTIYCLCHIVEIVKLPSLQPNCWIKANVNQSGFYRVKYDTNNWHLLIRHLRETQDGAFVSGRDCVNVSKGTIYIVLQALSPVDRAGLLDDVFSLSR